MGRFGLARTASTLITLFGCVTNAILALQVASAWRSFTSRGEQESEWEGLSDKWDTNGLRLVWGLFFVYFASSTTVSAVGLHGVLRAKASQLRFYRDFSIADFAFSTVSALFAAYAAFVGRARARLCEELSHHPDLMREMLEMGLNLENCEIWLERAVFAIVAIMLVVTLVRLHFLFAVSHYYSQLIRHHSCHHHHYPPQRILLVTTSTQSHTTEVEESPRDLEMVYAPVRKDSLPKELQDKATEAWVSTTPSSHGRRHSRYCHRSSKDRTGRIRLNVVPGEGLFPPYDSPDAEPKS
jgi:hypothetical protein